MEKKRSFVIVARISIASLSMMFYSFTLFIGLSIAPNNTSFYSAVSNLWLLCLIGTFASAVGILFLNKDAWFMAISLLIANIIFTTIIYGYNIFYYNRYSFLKVDRLLYDAIPIFCLFFFTRPKVKQQFK